ncbi:MAG: hypothetical protein Q9196_002298 [Gyalolechia fulgens]
MAEAVAAISLAASIIQLLKFGTEVIGRLQEYRTRSKETPTVFHDISVQLPLLIADLRVTKEKAEKNGLPFDVAESVSAIVRSCRDHIGTLDEILTRTMPDPTDSAWKTGKKVILSFRQEEKVRLVAEKLRSYVIYLTHHAVTSNLQAPEASRSGLSRYDEQFRMLQWLSNEDPSIDHNRAVQKKQKGSGQWIDDPNYRQLAAGRLFYGSLSHDAFFDLNLTSPSFIFSSAIIEALQEVLEAETSSTIAYWYFDFDKSSSLSVCNMLRSLIKQLCIGETDLPVPVQEMCAKYRASGHQPTTKALLATLHSTIDSVRKKTFLILDALDEYPPSRRQELLAAIKLLTDSEHEDVHVLMTSRGEFDIEHALSTVATEKVIIQGDVVDGDIRMHVRATLLEDARFGRLPPSIKDTIEAQLVSKAHGMSVLKEKVIGFRWVDCQLDTLRACNKVSAIKKSLGELPATLDETYERILRAIEPADADEAYRILQWLAFAERPLTLEEIAEAAVTNGDGGPIDPEERLFDPYEVLRICNSLISVTEDTLSICGSWTTGKVVRFAHFSVKEYLLSPRVLKTYHMDTRTSQQQIGQSCLSALLQNDEVDADQQSPLVKYAAQYWFQHLRNFQACANDTSSFKVLVERLFAGSPNAFRNWLLVYDVNIRRAHDSSSRGRKLSEFPTPLYYASFLGLEDAVRVLLISGMEINVHGGFYSTALIAAASQGHLATVQILLDHNANVHAEGGWTFFTALQAASFFGHKLIAELLLDKGEQPDRRREDDDTALGLACEAGHRSIVELLISRGSDVNLLAGGYGYPLSAAAERGQYDIVCLLLRKGAKVNNKGGLYSTALQAAASGGSEPIVQLLLDEGADVNVYGGVFSDALRASSIRRHHTIVKILLEHGASIEHLVSLLLKSSIEAPNMESTNSRLAEQLQTAFANARDSISHFAALVKEVHFHIRSQEMSTRHKQATSAARPNLLRLQKLVKQAVQSDFSRGPSHLQNRFYNAALEIRNRPTSGLGNLKT